MPATVIRQVMYSLCCTKAGRSTFQSAFMCKTKSFVSQSDERWMEGEEPLWRKCRGLPPAFIKFSSMAKTRVLIFLLWGSRHSTHSIRNSQDFQKIVVLSLNLENPDWPEVKSSKRERAKRWKCRNEAKRSCRRSEQNHFRSQSFRWSETWMWHETNIQQGCPPFLNERWRRRNSRTRATSVDDSLSEQLQVFLNKKVFHKWFFVRNLFTMNVFIHPDGYGAPEPCLWNFQESSSGWQALRAGVNNHVLIALSRRLCDSELSLFRFQLIILIDLVYFHPKYSSCGRRLGKAVRTWLLRPALSASQLKHGFQNASKPWKTVEKQWFCYFRQHQRGSV